VALEMGGVEVALEKSQWRAALRLLGFLKEFQSMQLE